MKHKRITNKNFGNDLKSIDDVVPVRGKHYNDMVDDFDANIPGDGLSKSDIVSEYTFGKGVTVDGMLLKDGIVGKVVTVVASSGGTGTGQLTGASQFVTVVSSTGIHVIGLPLLSSVPIGTVIRGHTSSTTGCEIRAMEQNTGTTVNNVTGAVESAIPADTTFKVEAVTATDWILTTVDSSGAVQVIVPDTV